ncbi:hypothetical protein A2108_03020 [Candidatus Wolfebacteria bacterium GWA1_42_9]|uniref:Uncharacterized protein n=1 Tax=Candidatus Wolfebacteria bacterium GWA1_42_9 TaxID=1802553 RepID=A0A1F8DNB7_9BACT|nr:MAG: hypothetical protein A2108_03020 [Candidatus Wolfebacteria bacterium GWA1_42_9]
MIVPPALIIVSLADFEQEIPTISLAVDKSPPPRTLAVLSILETKPYFLTIARLIIFSLILAIWPIVKIAVLSLLVLFLNPRLLGILKRASL